MFTDRYFPTDLSADELDEYLEKGWFRIAQSVFTTSFLTFHNELYSAVWLRVRLDEYEPEKKNKRILQQNRRFKVEIGPARISPEHESLYRKYRKSLSFNASSSLPELLFANAFRNIFNTWQVNVTDEERGQLIASGFFDLGKNAAAGITSFYDPEYKKFSLGKFLILLKMEHCKQLGMHYFYPGYFAPGYPLFNYKLTMGSEFIEFFETCDNTWKPISAFVNEQTPVSIIQHKLTAVQDSLSQVGALLPLYKYEYFEANLYPELQGENLFDYPIFLLQHHDVLTDFVDVIVYDITTSVYRCITCYSVWNSSITQDRPDVYSRHLLKAETETFTSSNHNEVVQFVVNRVKRDLKV